MRVLLFLAVLLASPALSQPLGLSEGPLTTQPGVRPSRQPPLVEPAQVLAHPAHWHGRRVRMRGLFRQGFEVSSFANDFWVSGRFRREGFPVEDESRPVCKCACHTGVGIEHEAPCCGIGKPLRAPRPPDQADYVEVWGRLDTAAGQYGHLSAYKAEIDAELIRYLGTPVPEAR